MHFSLLFIAACSCQANIILLLLPCWLGNLTGESQHGHKRKLGRTGNWLKVEMDWVEHERLGLRQKKQIGWGSGRQDGGMPRGPYRQLSTDMKSCFSYSISCSPPIVPCLSQDPATEESSIIGSHWLRYQLREVWQISSLWNGTTMSSEASDKLTLC